MTISESYSVLIKQEHMKYEKMCEDKTLFIPPVYELVNTVKIISLSPEVIDNVLTIHELAHYKRTKITNEISSSVHSNIEALCFREVDNTCIVI